jgi:hypothetical protein
MPDMLPEVVPALIVAAGFIAGFYVRHRISLKRKKVAKHAFFKQI